MRYPIKPSVVLTHTFCDSIPLVLLRLQHQLRPYVLVEVLLAQRFQLHRTFLEGETLLVRILRHFTRHVIPNYRIQARNKHQALVQQTANPLFICFQPLHKIYFERAHPVAEKADAVEQVVDHDRFEDIEFELAVHARDGYRLVIPHHLRADHCYGFGLRGIDFPRHDGAARLVFW